MMLIARLCALCAVCSFAQMMLPEERQSGFHMIAGLLMLHLVVSGMQDTVKRLLDAKDFMQMLGILIG